MHVPTRTHRQPNPSPKSKKESWTHHDSNVDLPHHPHSAQQLFPVLTLRPVVGRRTGARGNASRWFRLVMLGCGRLAIRPHVRVYLRWETAGLGGTSSG
jgi:hypothetical protein